MQENDAFVTVQKKAEAFLLCKNAVDVFTRNLKEIDEAVKGRIRRQRGENNLRITLLKEAVNDPAASSTLRRMSALELESCEAATFTATVEEIMEFESAKGRAYDALHDMDTALREFREAHAAAEAELKKIKNTVIPPTYTRGFEEGIIDRTVDMWEKRTISGDFA